MPIVKIRTNRQVTIPKKIFDELGLKEGEYVEVLRRGKTVVLKPKVLVDPDDLLTPEDEESLRRGLAELERGETSDWEEVKERLKL
jgi:AbrB family looped-hinge helix DNA binding protein